MQNDYFLLQLLCMLIAIGNIQNIMQNIYPPQETILRIVDNRKQSLYVTYQKQHCKWLYVYYISLCLREFGF